MSTDAPLKGMRVLEYATGVAGPYAGRLLAMFGATVAKVEPPGGDPARRQPVDDKPILEGSVSPLYVHLNAGKHNVAPDQVDPSWAHIVLADQVLSQLKDGPLDPANLNGPKLVTTTAWGAHADDPGSIDDELLVQAATGFLGFNRDPDDGPLRLPGWQSQYAAGGLAATAALTAPRMAAKHIDVSWYGAMLTCVELCYCDALHCERRREPVGAHPPTAFPSGAIPCRDGFVSPGSIRPIDWEMQCLMYGAPEWIDNPEYAHRHQRPAKIDEIWERVEPWYAERTKRELFQFALDTPWAIGMVMTPTDALADEHLLQRGFIGPITTPTGTVTGPVQPVRMPGLPVPNQHVEASAAGSVPELGPATARRLRPFGDIRVLDMTIAWAGPYAGNILGPMGVDLIKIESMSPYDGFRTQRPYDHGMKPGQEDLVHDNRFFEAGGFYNSVNKSKRSCVVTLATDEGREAFLELVRNSDALIANFSAGVLPKLGLDFQTLSAVNPKFVVVRAPAFGVDGPYSDAVGYGSIIEAMSGLGHRQGYEHEGARVSNIYLPDPLAGIHIALSLLVGLDRADRTGLGVEIDLSQQEVTWLSSGEALVLAASEGRDIGRMGNREPGVDLAELWDTSDGWIAVVADRETAPAVRARRDKIASLPMADATAVVVAAGGKAVAVHDPWSAPNVEPLASALELVEHPVTGSMRHIASPFLVDGVRPTQRSHAPLFDQHTDEIFREVAGLGDSEIEALRAGGHIGGELPVPASIGLRY